MTIDEAIEILRRLAQSEEEDCRKASLLNNGEFNIAHILEIKLSLDGDSYYAMVGKDLQMGLTGFGDTPCNALRELINEMERHYWNLDGITIY